MGWNRDGSGEDRHLERARRLAEASDHDAVTAELLGGEGRFATTFYLYDEPVVAHLDEEEVPRFAFYDRLKGIGVRDEAETYAPDNNGLTVTVVTDRRVVGLVGRAEGDHEVAHAYDVVVDAGYETGDLHHRLVVETLEETYHFPVGREFDPEDLERAVAYVEERMADPDQIVERTDVELPGEPADSSVASDGRGSPATDAPDAAATGGDPPSDDRPAPTPSDGGDPGDGSGGDDPGADTDDAGPVPDDSGGATDPGAPVDDHTGAPVDDHGAGDARTDDEEGAGDGDGDGDGGGDGGGATGADGPDPLDRIEKLHELKEMGAITEAEYERKKAELLDQV